MKSDDENQSDSLSEMDISASLNLRNLSSKIEFKGTQTSINFLLHALVRLIHETHCRWIYGETKSDLMTVIDDLESTRTWMFAHGIDPEDLFDLVELMSKEEIDRLDEFACAQAVIARNFWRYQEPVLERKEAEFLAKSWTGYVGV